MWIVDFLMLSYFHNDHTGSFDLVKLFKCFKCSFEFLSILFVAAVCYWPLTWIVFFELDLVLLLFLLLRFLRILKHCHENKFKRVWNWFVEIAIFFLSKGHLDWSESQRDIFRINCMIFYDCRAMCDTFNCYAITGMVREWVKALGINWLSWNPSLTLHIGYYLYCLVYYFLFCHAMPCHTCFDQLLHTYMYSYGMGNELACVVGQSNRIYNEFNQCHKTICNIFWYCVFTGRPPPTLYFSLWISLKYPCCLRLWSLCLSKCCKLYSN